jgi:heme exporter protein C
VNTRVPILIAIFAVMLAASPFLVDAAPPEATMGLVQKIFYVHLPSAYIFLIASLICGWASLSYLFRGRRPAHDHAALAAAELIIIFGAITLVTGPLWGRKAWGVYWVWDARLTSSLVLWLLACSYVMLRRFGGPGSELLCAGVGVFGTALVPFVYWSVNMWRTLHPQTTVMMKLPLSMGVPFWWCFAGFSAVAAVLFSARTRLARLTAELDAEIAEADA